MLPPDRSMVTSSLTTPGTMRLIVPARMLRAEIFFGLTSRASSTDGALTMASTSEPGSSSSRLTELSVITETMVSCPLSPTVTTLFTAPVSMVVTLPSQTLRALIFISILLRVFRVVNASSGEK